MSRQNPHLTVFSGIVQMFLVFNLSAFPPPFVLILKAKIYKIIFIFFIHTILLTVLANKISSITSRFTIYFNKFI